MTDSISNRPSPNLERSSPQLPKDSSPSALDGRHSTQSLDSGAPPRIIINPPAPDPSERSSREVRMRMQQVSGRRKGEEEIWTAPAAGLTNRAARNTDPKTGKQYSAVARRVRQILNFFKDILTFKNPLARYKDTQNVRAETAFPRQKTFLDPTGNELIRRPVPAEGVFSQSESQTKRADASQRKTTTGTTTGMRTPMVRKAGELFSTVLKEGKETGNNFPSEKQAEFVQTMLQHGQKISAVLSACTQAGRDCTPDEQRIMNNELRALNHLVKAGKDRDISVMFPSLSSEKVAIADIGQIRPPQQEEMTAYSATAQKKYFSPDIQTLYNLTMNRSSKFRETFTALRPDRQAHYNYHLKHLKDVIKHHAEQQTSMRPDTINSVKKSLNTIDILFDYPPAADVEKIKSTKPLA